MAGAKGAGEAGAGATSLVVLVAACVVLGTTLRAIGRGLGSGTFGLVAASFAHADHPSASTRLVAKAVDRNMAARENGVTAFLRGESFSGRRHRLYLIEYVDKIRNTPWPADVCAMTAAKSRLAGRFRLSPDRQTRYELTVMSGTTVNRA
jgi:hypothetical protein